MEQMTLEQIENTLEELNLSEEEQIEWLRNRCDELEIAYHHKAGYEKLTNLILNHYNKPEAKETPVEEVVGERSEAVELQFKSLDRYPDENDTAYAARKRKEAHKLILVRITCMNPVKKELQGEVFTVSNDLFTIKRMIPFHGEPTHIEIAFLDVLRERKFQQFREQRKSSLTDAPMQQGYLVPEFAIEVMEALSKEQLEQLALEQSRSARVG